MSHITPENLRFHAAGHLASAILLVGIGDERGARAVLAVVDQYVNHEKVDAPPQLKEKMTAALESPAANIAEINLLEKWFCDPLNTEIEKSGGRF